MSKTRFNYSPVLALLALGAGCYAGDGRLLEPGSGSSQSGDVEKQGLTLTVVTDSALAAALGWESDVVAGAEVIVQRGSDPAHRDTVVSDENGVVRLDELIPGDYKVWGWYRLSEAERIAVAEAGHDTWVLGNGTKLRVPAEQRFVLHSDEPSGLVISEHYFPVKWTPGVGTYHFGGYMELYNNGDTTVYLDGMIIGRAWAIQVDYSSLPCSESEPFRNDPNGVWARAFQAFPGSGADFPLPPGKAVVIAVDAIDHSSLEDGMLDLSESDFEFSGTEDADNPSVPNMIDVGLIPFPLGHGLFFTAGPEVPFLALGVDVSSLSRAPHPTSGREYARIPADHILDVAAFGLLVPVGRYCDVMVHRRFERLEAHLFDSGRWMYAFHRRVAGTRADGRVRLQRTRTSAVDFAEGSRSPGSIPR